MGEETLAVGKGGSELESVTDTVRLVVFKLDEMRYAINLSTVERVIRAVEITPLPKSPDIVLGVINLHGTIIPVLNVRRRFRLPGRDLLPSDQIVIARSARRDLGLIVDAVAGVVEFSAGEITASKDIVPGILYLEGVVRLEGDIVFIHDIDKFLGLDETSVLDAAVSGIGV